MNLVSLSSGVFERSTLTGSGLFSAHLSHDFEQTFSHIVSIRVKTLSNTNLVSSRNIKREKGSFPVDVRRSKTFSWLSSLFSLCGSRPFAACHTHSTKPLYLILIINQLHFVNSVLPTFHTLKFWQVHPEWITRWFRKWKRWASCKRSTDCSTWWKMW